MRRLSAILALTCGVALLGVVFASDLAGAQTAPPCDTTTTATLCFFIPHEDQAAPLDSLKKVTKAQDPQLGPGGPFVRSQTTLVVLGKALFWDQQVGSDGQACASCHFAAGADSRRGNAVSPGLNASPADTTFSLGSYAAPNSTLSVNEFPTHKLTDIVNRSSPIIHDSNDVVGSAGVFFRTFNSVGTIGDLTRPVASVPDFCTSRADPDGFQVGGRQRQTCGATQHTNDDQCAI